jgi:hypothetical protein
MSGGPSSSGVPSPWSQGRRAAHPALPNGRPRSSHRRRSGRRRSGRSGVTAHQGSSPRWRRTTTTLTELLVAGGELTWQAGPLEKGAGLCHGTAGNGYCLLKLFERTGDELWLHRARAFAMHAIHQVERTTARYGRGRHTLWTGDPGTALYLQS